ncbi:MAG: DUF1573 domain-containing protein [Bacteroidales bacterium]
MKPRHTHFLLFFLPVLLWGAGCTQQGESEAAKSGVELFFEEPVFDYGTIPEDGDGTHTFVCKNLGKEAVVINRVRSTCGCTVPEWPREPLEPGATGEILVKYNTAQTGTFLKSLYVYSTAANTPVKLQIKGKVNSKTS